MLFELPTLMLVTNIELTDVVTIRLAFSTWIVDIALFNDFINSYLFEGFIRKFSQSAGHFDFD